VNVVGYMIYWDEQPHWLSTCVSGFARVCDSIVAVDGAYALLPGGKPRSHPDQAYAIQDACEAEGVGCVIHRPQHVWYGNEVEKRQQALSLAGTLNPDWVWVFDSDYLVVRLDNPAHVRSLLERTEANVAAYTVVDSHDDGDSTSKDRAVFRWTPDLRYGPAHYHVSGTFGGAEEWLRGPDKDPRFAHLAAPVEDLLDNVVVRHRNKSRSADRARVAAGFASLRDSMEVEKFVPEEVWGGLVAA
jgi:hypothetical protein